MQDEGGGKDGRAQVVQDLRLIERARQLGAGDLAGEVEISVRTSDVHRHAQTQGVVSSRRERSLVDPHDP